MRARGGAPGTRPALVVLRAELAELEAVRLEIATDGSLSEVEAITLLRQTRNEIADLREAIEQLQFMDEWT